MKPAAFIQRFNFKWLMALVAVTTAWVNLNHERWLSKSVIEHDIISYYAYLPATFIEQDLSLKFLNDPARQASLGKYWPNRTPAGNYVIKMSMGMALSYLPFFALAHGYAKLFNYPADGFSEPYQFAVLFSSLVYLLLGFYFLWKVLTRLFPERIALLSLFCLFFGTNLFYYVTIGGGLAHAVGFLLVSLFLHLTQQWYLKPSLRVALLLGLTGGLLVLVRPVNGLIFIFFFLFTANKAEGLSPGHLKRTLPLLLVIPLAAFIVLLPQLLYWKYVSGHFIFNSYVGERFYFDRPHILNGLFSFRKGWLVYTPIMIFSLAGIFFLKGTLKNFLLPVLLFTCIYLYVCFSWWCWWYGGSFGQRALIDIYPVLAIPFAALLSRVIALGSGIKKSLYATLALFIFLNLFQTMQAKYNIIHFDSMTRANYFEVFFTTTKKPDREKYLQHPDYEKALRGEDEY